MARNDHDRLEDSVRKTRERRERAAREGGRTLGQNIAWMGTLGWLIVAPMLLGLFVGRWLDHALGTGVTFSSALCILGLALGAFLGWRKVAQR